MSPLVRLAEAEWRENIPSKCDTSVDPELRGVNIAYVGKVRCVQGRVSSSRMEIRNLYSQLHCDRSTAGIEKSNCTCRII